MKRFNPDVNVGLNDEQVELRKNQKLVNITKAAVGKSYSEIIFTDVLSFFNVVLFIIAGLMIYAGYYSGLFFLLVVIPNMLIGLYQDLKARYILGKLNLLTQPKVTVIRNGAKCEINTNEIVLDDIVILNASNQICVDGIVLDGTLSVNESLLTGESLDIHKNVNDQVLSGSFVTSGKAIIRATAVGKDCFAAKLQNQANQFKRSPSQILKSLRMLFQVIGTIVILMALATVIVYFVQGRFANIDSIKEAIGSISGSLVAMIPSGLYFLTSLALATAVINLAKKHARVQDFYSVEMLARTNVLCVDKTGTITDGSMSVVNIEVLSKLFNYDTLSQVISNVIHATGDDNLTAQALNKFFVYELTTSISNTLPFTSENKYSAATFSNGETYVIGAAEFINLENKAFVNKQMEKYTNAGMRVLVVGKTLSPIANNKVSGSVDGIGLIVLQDHVRDSAPETFKWFKENNVEIKVISGDNAQTVSQIAQAAQVENAEKYISLDGMSIEDVKKVAMDYNVFGRVTPQQKEALVLALKENGKTIAMTGDGVNDILALKRADCSIAMASGADAAKNVSHIILLDSDFASLPSVVAEGRRVINNIQRTSSLFLVKTIFAFIASLVFLLISAIKGDASINYPFVTNNLYLWEIISIGMSAFFIALQKNNELIEGSFLKNVLKKAVPAGAVMIFGITSIFVMYLMQKNNVTNVGFYSYDAAIGSAVLFMSIFSLVVLYKVCLPFDKYRKIVFASACGVDAIIIAITAILSYVNGNDANILLIPYNQMYLPAYFATLVVIVICSALYLLGAEFISLLKEKPNHDKN